MLHLELRGSESGLEVPPTFALARGQVAALRPVQAHPAAERGAGERHEEVAGLEASDQGIEHRATPG
jgi:hypothetical protein